MQETRRRIRAAADTLFLEQGYRDVSMDDIAQAAGYTDCLSALLLD